MANTPIDPDDAPRLEVQVYEDGRLLQTRRFATLEAAEAFAEECTEAAPGRRASISDLAHHHDVDQEVESGAVPAEDYPRPGSG